MTAQIDTSPDSVRPDVLPPVVIFSAPSGAGKTTIVKQMLARLPQLRFSVSATTRPPRDGEVNGRDYYFLSEAEFDRKRDAGEFVEFEEVYPGRWYGTPRAELMRIAAQGFLPMFEVDIKGGQKLKKLFGPRALALFIAPPSVEALGARLRARGTETEDEIQRRLARVDEEMSVRHEFDRIVVNDDLERALLEIEAAVADFLAP
jgi:guanylate kinase